MTDESIVKCPVCAEDVPESEINLHLDLRCRGISGPSSSGPRSSQASSSSKKTPTHLGKIEREVVEVDDDSPVKPTKAVASIFGNVGANKRKKPSGEEGEDKKSEEGLKRAATQRGADKVPKKELSAATQLGEPVQAERKPRVNPLLAAQPYVIALHLPASCHVA